MRSRLAPLSAAVAGVALLAGSAIAQAPADAEQAARLEQAERQLIQAANDWRIGQGVPPVVWSEQLAIVLREICHKAVAAGYEGGDYPREVGRAPQRARDLYGWKTQIFDNFSTAGADEFDAARMIGEQIAHPAIKQYPNAELRLGAAAVLRSQGGKWICLIALAKGPHEAIEAVQHDLATEVEQLASADAATRAAACAALGKRNHVEALPGLRTALRHADAATRAAAAGAMGDVRSRGIIPPLLAALRDPGATVTQAAATALSKLTGRTDLGVDADQWAKWWGLAIDSFKLPLDGSAAQDTTPTGDAAAGKSVDELLGEWNDACNRKDTIQKVAILEALRDMPESEKNAKVEAVMTKGLGDSEAAVRVEAIRGVARLKVRSAVPILMKLVDTYEERSDDTARYALLGLAQIGDLKAMKTFTASAWSSKNVKVLGARIFAIRYMRHAASVEWLLGLFTAGVGGRRGGGFGGGLQAARKVAFDSLEFLTGERFGNDHDAWHDWWKKAKNRFRPEPLPDGYEVEGLFPRPKGGQNDKEKGRRAGRPGR